MITSEAEKFRQAIELAALGQLQEAYQALKELRQNHPDDPNLLLWLAYTTPDLNEARAEVTRAAELDPNNKHLPAAQQWITEQNQRRFGRRYRMALVAPTVTTAIVPVPKATPKLPELPSPSFREPPKPAQPGLSRRRRIELVLALLVLIIAGVLIFEPDARNAVFNSGPLSKAEQSYVNDLNTLDYPTESTLNQAFSSLANSNSPASWDQAYRTLLSGFSDVTAKFNALKSHSDRFAVVHSQFQAAYSQFDTIYKKSLEVTTQKTVATDRPAMLQRLDEARRAYEAAKGELKRLVTQYGGQR